MNFNKINYCMSEIQREIFFIRRDLCWYGVWEIVLCMFWNEEGSREFGKEFFEIEEFLLRLY